MKRAQHDSTASKLIYRCDAVHERSIFSFIFVKQGQPITRAYFCTIQCNECAPVYCINTHFFSDGITVRLNAKVSRVGVRTAPTKSRCFWTLVPKVTSMNYTSGCIETICIISSVAHDSINKILDSALSRRSRRSSSTAAVMKFGQSRRLRFSSFDGWPLLCIAIRPSAVSCISMK